jgi:hypothetical protein
MFSRYVLQEETSLDCNSWRNSGRRVLLYILFEEGPGVLVNPRRSSMVATIDLCRSSNV